MPIYNQTFVYWIHLPEHTDIYSQGYVGVSNNPVRRLLEHQTDSKNNNHKNLPNYELYKTAIDLLDKGISADKVAVQLSIGRGVCFKLKNRSHLIFQAFPELS